MNSSYDPRTKTETSMDPVMLDVEKATITRSAAATDVAEEDSGCLR